MPRYTTITYLCQYHQDWMPPISMPPMKSPEIVVEASSREEAIEKSRKLSEFGDYIPYKEKPEEYFWSTDIVKIEENPIPTSSLKEK